MSLAKAIIDSGKVFVNGRLSSSALDNLEKIDLLGSLLEATSFLKNPSISERLYAVVYNLTEPPTCPECSNALTFLNFSRGYRTFCSKKCQAKSPDVKAKRLSANLERLGVSNAFQLPAVRKKAAAGTKSAEAQEKRKKTCLDKYGVLFNSQSSEVKEKKVIASLSKYGTEHPMQSHAVKEKIKERVREKYGVDYWFASSDFKAAMVDYYQKKYGVDNFMATPTFRSKSSATLLKNYGVTNPSHHSEIIDRIVAARKKSSHISSEAYEKLDDKLWLTTEHVESKKPLSIIAKSLGISPSTLGKHFGKHEISVRLTCGESVGELELRQFITSIIEDEVVAHDRTILDGQEIDIFIPARNLGIEFNGAYWHSSEKKDKKYHLSKFLACRENGIHLIQVFDYEWILQQPIVKARIKSILKVDFRIYARNCTVGAISTEAYQHFVAEHHLQGYSPAKIKLGLHHNGALVAVMGFSKPRYSKKYDFELLRYCSTGSVVGGAGKLFKFFVLNYKPTSIISYADRAWSNGNLYLKLGFSDITGSAEPLDYWYVVDGVRKHRSNFTKKSLIKKGAALELTEAEIMKQSGALKIYGCGSYKFLWSTKTESS